MAILSGIFAAAVANIFPSADASARLMVITTMLIAIISRPGAVISSPGATSSRLATVACFPVMAPDYADSPSGYGVVDR